MIESEQNERFKSWRKLLDPKQQKKGGKYLLFGERVVQEYLQLYPETVLEEIIPEQMSAHLFAQLDVFATKTRILVCKLPKLETWDQRVAPTEPQILLPLGDPANMGAALRTAAGLGFKKIMLLKEACSPFHPKSVRAAAGALPLLNFYLGPSIADLQCQPIILDKGGTDLGQWRWPQSGNLLVGEEGAGVPASLGGTRISIAMDTGLESLNANVALSIALYDWKKTR